jgi:hypothetical protein
MDSAVLTTTGADKMTNRLNVSANMIPAAEYKFAGEQAARAEGLGVTHVLVWPSDSKLPKYAAEQLAASGLAAHQIGRTTYRSRTFALIPIAEKI